MSADVYVATKNAGKLRELEAIFGATDWRIRTFAAYADVVEGESSYAGNAALKARALRAQLIDAGVTAAVLGDDSGLEIDALGGRPGVLSARYGGPALDWAGRRRALLAEVDRASGTRAAAFVCALHLIDARGREVAVERRLPGTIAKSERGDGGFSYDAIFVYPPLGRTFAELGEAEKNRVSHRALAAAALLAAAGPVPAGSNRDDRI